MFWSWAHPRSRGENTWLHKDTGLPSGSSPLTRGKRGHPPTRRLRVGLIPAHAGKTCELGVHQRHRRAHPRSRGENAAGIASVALTQGSSPLTRGKRTNSPPFKRAGRLIPAHAGKTRHHQRPSPHRRAHPRSRGENARICDLKVAEEGSSPLTRGKHFLTCTFIAQIGQILESLELCASFESYSLSDAYATDAPRDRVRSIGLAPPSSRAASSA